MTYCIIPCTSIVVLNERLNYPLEPLQPTVGADNECLNYPLEPLQPTVVHGQGSSVKEEGGEAKPPPGQARGPHLHSAAAPCPYEGERPPLEA